jgi:hypothetical protein
MVVDNLPSDDTPQIAEELADIVIATGPERMTQRNAGASAPIASIVGFTDSDMVVALSIIEAVRGVFLVNRSVASVQEKDFESQRL